MYIVSYLLRFVNRESPAGRVRFVHISVLKYLQFRVRLENTGGDDMPLAADIGNSSISFGLFDDVNADNRIHK